MSEYDSILKEKKKYIESESSIIKKRKHFPWFKMDLFCVVIILVVSYFVYYRTVLAADKVFLSDFSRLMDTYQLVFQHLNLDKLDTSYQLEGKILFEDLEYRYGVIRDQEKMKFHLSSQEHSFDYYLESGKRYIQLSNFVKDYVGLDGDSYVYELLELKKHFLDYVSQDKYIKKFYLDGYVPIVEADLVLKSDEVRQILGLSGMDGAYVVLFTFKNHAITNEIISMKVAINEINSNRRYVITYQDGVIVYSDDLNGTWKIGLERSGDDFTLKIYQGEILYSVLSGTNKESSYEYMYQVIDQIYNISLDIHEEEDGYLYIWSSNIEKDGVMKKRTVQVTLSFQEEAILEEDVSKGLSYDLFSLEEQERYKLELENMIGYLRQFVEEYK